jgi:hypothetical protein
VVVLVRVLAAAPAEALVRVLGSSEVPERVLEVSEVLVQVRPVVLKKGPTLQTVLVRVLSNLWVVHSAPLSCHTLQNTPQL